MSGRLVITCVIQAGSAITGVVPLVAVVEIGRVLLPALDGQPVDGDRARLMGWIAALALLIRLVLATCAALVSHFADVELQLSIRRSLVEAMGRVPLAWFGDRNSGAVKKAVQDDVASLHHVVAHAVLDITAAVVVPVVSIVYLISVNPLMTLVTLLPGVLGILAYGLAMRGAMEKYPVYDASLRELESTAVEFVDGIAVVKTFGQSGRAHGRFRDASRRFDEFFTAWSKSSAVASTAMEILIAPVTVLGFVVVGGLIAVGSDHLAAVDVLPFLVLGLGLTAPLVGLVYGMQSLREGTAALERIASVLDAPELPRPCTEGPNPTSPRVELRNVSFGYDPENPVLHDIDLDLRPGTVTALIGASGSGKSSLARLLPRFADVQQGAVLLDGTDVRDLTEEQLYRNVSFVFQDVHLLRTTVRDNIRLARPDADEETVVAAARTAQIHDRILELPHGYDSVVGEDANLSGGEAQRVSIARALLADTGVLVLDEATAFADPESEARIQDALTTLAAGRTLLVIAHRLSTIQHADQIVVLEAGRIVEHGRHDELLRLGGRYSRSWAADQRTSIEVAR